MLKVLSYQNAQGNKRTIGAYTELIDTGPAIILLFRPCFNQLPEELSSENRFSRSLDWLSNLVISG